MVTLVATSYFPPDKIVGRSTAETH